MALVWEHFCGRVCRDPNFTVTWCADLERLWVCLTFRAIRRTCLPLWRNWLWPGCCAADSVPGCCPVVVGGCASLFGCTAAVRASDSMTALTSGLGLDDMSTAWPAVVQLLVFVCSGMR